ncbi:MAG: sigma-70 family RNA polymerase sigma factor [Thermoleophilaceae bacterium]
MTQEMLRQGSWAGARTRPTRAEIDPAALELIERYGASLLRTARRYSLNAEDAEDAYQRGLEILLTKAPSTSEADLLPWLKTVVKHEAFAIRRQRQRTELRDDDSPWDGASPSTDEQAERFERLRIGAEALGRLKPQETRALLLKAQGLSYEEICAETGWTYTKVNRCLTEGRRAFLDRVAGIESGAECDRLAPQLSALADGEASAEDMALLRPHLRSCLYCRGALREYREAPARVAALAPGGLLALDALDDVAEGSWSLIGWLHDRFVIAWMRAHEAALSLMDLATGTKVAAVAASTAAIAGGGAVAVNKLEPPAAQHAPAVATQIAKPPRAHVALPPKQRRQHSAAHRQRARRAATPVAPIRAVTQPAPVPAPSPSPAPAPAPAPAATPQPPPSGEFGP